MTSADLIRSGNIDKAFKELYKSFPHVKRYIKQNSGSKSEAEDTFQQGLFVFHEKLQDPNFKLTAAPEAYVFSVCRLLWKEQLRAKKKLPSDHSEQDDFIHESDISDILEKESKLQRIEKAIMALGDKCRQILQLFYFKKKSLTEISQTMNYSSVNATKTRKYKCMESLKNAVRHEK